MDDYYNNIKVGRKCFKFKKFVCLCIFTLFVLMSANIHKVFAATDTQTISGVTFTIITDKDEYELGELANVTFIVKNDNPYDVEASDFEFELPEWMKLENNFFNQSIPAGESITLTTTMDFTFEDWKTVELNGQKINVGICALYDTIEPGSTLQVQVIKKGTAEYESYWNKLDKKNNIKHAELLNISVRQKNGIMYSELARPATIYIEIPDGWQESEMQAIYASAGIDEEFEENFITIDGVRYLCFETDHFSPYVIADSFTPASLKTGDKLFNECYAVMSIFTCLVVAILFACNKKSLALCLILLVTPLFSSAGFDNVSAETIPTVVAAQDNSALTFKMIISKFALDFKMKIFGKHKHKDPKNIKLTVENNILEVRMDDVPKGWRGKIIFEDKSGYDNYQKDFGYRDMNYKRGSYRYKMRTHDLPNGTYDIKICDKNDKQLFVKNNVVLHSDN